MQIPCQWRNITIHGLSAACKPWLTHSGVRHFVDMPLHWLTASRQVSLPTHRFAGTFSQYETDFADNLRCTYASTKPFTVTRSCHPVCRSFRSTILALRQGDRQQPLHASYGTVPAGLHCIRRIRMKRNAGDDAV